MRFAAIYGAGAAMGFAPDQIDRMSLWQFMACVEGYMKANGSGGGGLSESEQDEIWEWMKTKETGDSQTTLQ